MEDIFAYIPGSVVPDAIIEGIDAIKNVTMEWKRYVRECNEYEDGLRDKMPEKPKESIRDVELRHFGAAVYLQTEQWICTRDPIMVRLGEQAQKRLRDGDDPDTVLKDMLSDYDAFKLAQEG